jgi:hypothetical protein
VRIGFGFGKEGGVESTMSLYFNFTRQFNSLWLTRRDRSHLSSSSHFTLLIKIWQKNTDRYKVS